jgi:hypothetical protein
MRSPRRSVFSASPPVLPISQPRNPEKSPEHCTSRSKTSHKTRRRMERPSTYRQRTTSRPPWSDTCCAGATPSFRTRREKPRIEEKGSLHEKSERKRPRKRTERLVRRGSRKNPAYLSARIETNRALVVVNHPEQNWV